jgi:phospholipid/cholesterol/gamma-HCH transport system substrate-binding protein
MDPHKHLRWAELRVGLLVLVGAGLLIFILAIVGSNIKLFTPEYRLMLFVPNIEGLVNGSMVTLAGRKVGYVSDMRFVQVEGQNGVQVELELDKTFQDRITDHSQAIIRTIGLLGDKYVDISLGNPGERVLKEGEYLKIIGSVDFEVFTSKLNTSFDDFAATLASMRHITKRLDEEDLGKFVRSMNSVVNALTAQRGSAGKLIYDPALYRQLSSVAENLDTVTTLLKRGHGTLGKMIVDSTLYRTLASFSSRSDSLVSNLMHSGSAGRVFNDDQLYSDLMKLIKELDALVTDIRTNPDRYVQVKIF